MFASSDVHWLEELLYTQSSRQRHNAKRFGDLPVAMRMDFNARATEILEGILERVKASAAKAEGAGV